MIFGILAHNGFAKAPTILSLDGETLQIAGNTVLGFKSPPVSVERAWVARYIDLAEIDRNNEVLASKGHNIDLATILYRLAYRENWLRNTCVVDVNGLLSCGPFQFQLQTFKNRCIGSNIMDVTQQIECAIDMIMNGEGHTFGGWYNSWRALQLPIIK